MGWVTIGISVAATQASAITFISTPGQGYESGLDFVQNYFGMPLALIIIAAVFLPIYRRLNVYTAYEFLGRRFDAKTRLLGAALFLVQRGLAAGITIYAPAIILSTVLGWRLDLTIILSGLLVIIYTVTGGSKAVSLTQKYQMAVIFGGMVAAFVILLMKLPTSLGDAFTVAGGFKKLEAVSFSFDLHRRYTFWTGLLGGLFLSLSYFGSDQSQVQRYITGPSLRESRLGLMFNAVLKIPMQFFILLLGVMLFVFYQFEQPPVFFNQAAWHYAVQHDSGGKLHALEQEFTTTCAQKEQLIRQWLDAKHAGDAKAEAAARSQALAALKHCDDVRAEAKNVMQADDPGVKSNDADYVFVTFILDHLPHGLIGLADRGVLCRRAPIEVRRTERARLDHHGGFLPALVQTRGQRRALRGRLQMVHFVLGTGCARLCAVCEPGGEFDPGRQHRRLGFLRRGAGVVPGGVFLEAGGRHGNFLGGIGGPNAGLRSLLFAEHQLSLV